LNFFFFYCK